MQLMNKLSGWKLAWLIAWVCVLGLLGVTVAEMSYYTGIVQFYGDTLLLNWENEEEYHHYRATVSSRLTCSRI